MENFKRMTSVRQRNMVRLMVLIIALLIVLFSVYKGFAYAYSATLTPPEYEEVQVQVEYGDTAWEIQEALIPNEDVRRALYYASKANGKPNMSNIFAGETLIFYKIAE